MIVSCPECHTLYRHRSRSLRRARCGGCHAEIAIPSGRTYLIQRVERAPALALAAASVGAGSASTSRPWAERYVAVPAPAGTPHVPGRTPAGAAEPGRSLPWSGPTPVDERLSEIARAARRAEVLEGAALRSVLFGVGIGTIVGLAFGPGVFHSPWLGWVTGGLLGGVVGALWSGMWGSRKD